MPFPNDFLSRYSCTFLYHFPHVCTFLDHLPLVLFGMCWDWDPILDTLYLLLPWFCIQLLFHAVYVENCVNPFTPESDQYQISPAASSEIWHHTVWRTWLFIAYSDERWLYYKFSLPHSYNCSLKGCENALFELRSESVNATYESYSNL